MSARRALAVLLLATAALAAPSPVAYASHEHASDELAGLLEAARPGDTISVAPGTYRGNLEITVPVTLLGMGRPTIAGDGSGTVLTIRAPGTVVAGFLVTGSGPGPVDGPAGIRVEADDVTVRDVVVEDSYMGIAVVGARGTRLIGNVIRGRAVAPITGEEHAVAPDDEGEGAAGPEGVGASSAEGGGRTTRGDGISLWNAEETLIRDNVVEDSRDGVYLSFAVDSLVDRNVVLRSRYAIHSMFSEQLVVSENRLGGNLSGAVLMYGGDVLLLRNDIRDSASPATGFGVLLKDVAGIDAIQNVFVGNRVAIQIEGPAGDIEHETKIGLNTVAMNEVGLSLYPTAHAKFWGNSFVENVSQVIAQGSGVAGKNQWTYEGAGNYWSDYRGYDADGDGAGDVPHAEGGAVEGILVESPMLTALASGPAFSLIRAVEDRWVEREPAALDPVPLSEPHSPAVSVSRAGGSASGVLAGLGLAAVLAGAGVLVRFRRPSRRTQEGVRGAA